MLICLLWTGVSMGILPVCIICSNLQCTVCSDSFLSQPALMFSAATVGLLWDQSLLPTQINGPQVPKTLMLVHWLSSLEPHLLGNNLSILHKLFWRCFDPIIFTMWSLYKILRSLNFLCTHTLSCTQYKISKNIINYKWILKINFTSLKIQSKIPYAWISAIVKCLKRKGNRINRKTPEPQIWCFFSYWFLLKINGVINFA